MAAAAPAIDRLRLAVRMPTRIVLELDAVKVRAEAIDGEFCLRPRHVDFVAALVPGVLEYVPVAGDEAWVAVNGGILVKRGATVDVSTFEAVTGDDLAGLRERVEREFLVLDDRERGARSVLARLEAGLLRRFADLQGR